MVESSNTTTQMNTYLVKASWRATALRLKVRATDPDDAWDRAAKLVKRMEGGVHCLEITVLRQIS